MLDPVMVLPCSDNAEGAADSRNVTEHQGLTMKHDSKMSSV